jgi:hypothetical protein
VVSWLLDERFERAVAEARRARAELAGTGQGDLANRLAMLETLACIESDDMAGARATARTLDQAGLRRPVATLYRAIAAYADGQARSAIPGLREAHAYLSGHGDTLNAYLAAYYGSAALAEVGSIGAAQTLAERAWALAHGAGLRALAAQARAQQALIVGDAMQAGVAHRLAGEALSNPCIGPRSRVRAHCAHAHAYTLEGNITLALEHLAGAREAVTDPEMRAAQATVDVEQAAVDLVGGTLERAVEHAERAVAYYSERSRDYEGARSGLVLAAAYIARGRRSDLLLAERSIAQTLELAERGELHSIQVGCAILSAALARRGNRERAAAEVLAEALRRLDPERGSIFAGVLVAAIEGGAVARAVPGVVALLARLGFTDAVDCYLIDQHGRRAATEEDVARERSERDLFVDELRWVIVADRGEHEIRGRPMQCTLLSALIQARGEPVAPDAIYRQVWGGSEYHPLQHRNALYVAINRLRKSLRRVLPDREVIERAGNGWRVADGVDACVAVAARPAGG